MKIYQNNYQEECMMPEVPKLFKKAFTHLSDDRGFLNPLDINALPDFINSDKFLPAMQLLSFSKSKNTFRGLHYQSAPHDQSKLIFIHSGEILDFLVPVYDARVSRVEIFDLQPGDLLFVPSSYAHGFLTKTTDVCLQYIMDARFNKDSYSGIDAIDFVSQFAGREKLIVSEKDKNFKLKLKIND